MIVVGDSAMNARNRRELFDIRSCRFGRKGVDGEPIIRDLDREGGSESSDLAVPAERGWTATAVMEKYHTRWWGKPVMG